MSTRPGGRFPWRQARWLLYLLVIAGLLLARGHMRWRDLVPGAGGGGDSLTVAGRDLAPELVDRAIALYRRDDPELGVRVRGGGTNHALEDLLLRNADVAFLIRSPSAEEQELFRSADGDTALWFPVAWGGIAFFTAEGNALPPLTEADLRRLLEDGTSSRFDRVYVPDPNGGLWEDLEAALGLPVGDPGRGSPVVFLQDEREILEAVRADPRSLGVASTLVLPDSLPAPLALVSLAERGLERAVLPTYENIGHGVYPLLHPLYVACRGDREVEGAKFVTYVTSKQGQRGVERAGFVPAYRYLREVVLTTHPVGK